MEQTTLSDTKEVSLPVIQPAPQPSVSDQVFNALQQRILTLELPPQTKISEADVSKKMGVSRQPVREAFKRLAKLGFLIIRPQMRRQKEHTAKVAGMKKGDKVVTAGGLIGKVVKVKDDNEIEVELSEGVKVRVVQNTIAQVLSKTEPAK